MDSFSLRVAKNLLALRDSNYYLQAKGKSGDYRYTLSSRTYISSASGHQQFEDRMRAGDISATGSPMRSSAIASTLLASGVVVLMTACLRVTPKMPKVVALPAPIFYSPSEFDADVAAYRASIKAGNLSNAETERTQIVYRTLAQIDEAYGKFEINLSTTRAGYKTAADAASLGLTAAGTLVGATDIKNILSATATAFQGARTSFDKNFFEEKTTEALVSQMRASRKTLQAQIIDNLSTRDAASYPLEAAWTDIIGYYYAGTLPSALVAIASKAGSDDVKADQNLANAKALTTFTEAQAQSAISIRTAYTKLSQDLASTDPTRKSNAESAIRGILTKAGVSFDTTASSSDLLTAFRNAMAAASKDSAALRKLNSAVQSGTQ